MKGQGGVGAPKKRGDSTPRVHLGTAGLKSSVPSEPFFMPKAPTKPPASYEAALEELEQLVGLIESGQLPLEQLLAGYERGAELLKFCRDKLQAVEEQIKVLDAGALKPWTPE
jgi:exodeoxyribonuclease VII small subunit